MSRTASSRTRSLSRGVEDKPRPGFQTRYKLRGGGYSLLEDDIPIPALKTQNNSIVFADSKRAFDQSFEPTSRKLKDANFSHHDP